MSGLLENLLEIQSFKEAWLRIISDSPWADLAEIENVLKSDGAILVPIYTVHYEAITPKQNFKLQTVTTCNNDPPGIKPSEETLKRALDLVNLNCDSLVAKYRQRGLRTRFHEQYWVGHSTLCADQPALPELVQFILDKPISELYADQLRNSSNEDIVSGQELKSNNLMTDWALVLYMRVDRLFTDKKVEVNFDIGFYDNVAVGEGHWPVYCYALRLPRSSTTVKLAQDTKSLQFFKNKCLFLPEI